MKKTLLALALAGIATASFGFTVYSNDVASLTLSSSLKADFGYTVSSTTTDSSKLKVVLPKLTVTTKTPAASISVGDLDFAGDFNLDNYKTGFDLQLKVLNGYTFNTTTTTTTKVGDKSSDTTFKPSAKYEFYKLDNLSSTPFSIYFKSPKLGELTLGVNKSGIELDGTDASTVTVDSRLGDDKYLAQYDSFKFFNGFTVGASLNYSTGVMTAADMKQYKTLVSTYAGYVSYELPNSDVVKLTGVEGVAYSYGDPKGNSIRVLNNEVSTYQLAYINSSLVDNLTLEVAYAHSKTVSYDKTTLLADKENSNNKNGVFFNASYVYNDYLKPYYSIAYLNTKDLTDNATSVNTISSGIGLKSTLFSGYGVTVSSKLEVNGLYTKYSVAKMYEDNSPVMDSYKVQFKGFLKLEF